MPRLRNIRELGNLVVSVVFGSYEWHSKPTDYIDGDFLIVPWLVLGVFTVVAQVQSLVKE